MTFPGFITEEEHVEQNSRFPLLSQTGKPFPSQTALSDVVTDLLGMDLLKRPTTGDRKGATRKTTRKRQSTKGAGKPPAPQRQKVIR